jgi:hypothetical protein
MTKIVITETKGMFPIRIDWTRNGIKYSNAFETEEGMKTYCMRFGDVKFLDKRRNHKSI